MWVGGEKVSVRDSEKEYEELREYYRRKNKRLGYGDDSKAWSKEEYNRQREKLRALKKYNDNRKT